MEMVKPSTEAPSRTFIACARCKARKRKCDGATPCSNCIVHNAECSYAVIRRTRGPGKKDKRTETQDQEGKGNAPCITNQTPDHANLTVADTIDPHSTKRPSERPPIIFPQFLLSKTFPRDIKAFKTEINEATSTGGYSPLMPLHISKRLVENSFTEVIPDPQFISLEHFIELLEAQYADNTTGPGEDAARWAIVNAVVALAGRFKTAAGSEADMSPITLSFYRNASLVIHQLILHKPNLLSVQALLSMAIFARGIPDMDAFVMLTSNAFNQLEILRRIWVLGNQLLPLSGDKEFAQVFRFASQLSEEAYHVML
ncbi:hypothetical protein F4859DRAFT_308655 [Xylaria cf. heliscus]|nr:hypothetical protein F4859DRAFT_308655 [Xylaria cf. heliscus]